MTQKQISQGASSAEPVCPDQGPMPAGCDESVRATSCYTCAHFADPVCKDVPNSAGFPVPFPGAGCFDWRRRDPVPSQTVAEPVVGQGRSVNESPAKSTASEPSETARLREEVERLTAAWKIDIAKREEAREAAGRAESESARLRADLGRVERLARSWTRCPTTHQNPTIAAMGRATVACAEEILRALSSSPATPENSATKEESHG